MIGIEPQTTIATLAQHKASRFALSSDTTTDPAIIALCITDIDSQIANANAALETRSGTS